jgi:hypothetical protein
MQIHVATAALGRIPRQSLALMRCLTRQTENTWSVLGSHLLSSFNYWKMCTQMRVKYSCPCACHEAYREFETQFFIFNLGTKWSKWSASGSDHFTREKAPSVATQKVTGWTTEQNWTFWTTEKYFVHAVYRTTIPQLSGRWSLHCTDYNIPLPCNMHSISYNPKP